MDQHTPPPAPGILPKTNDEAVLLAMQGLFVEGAEGKTD